MKRPTRRSLALLSAAAMALCGCAAPQNTSPTLPDSSQSSGTGIHISLDKQTGINEEMFGLFLEDINFAVDAGLYAELIKNRSFEYGDLAAQGAKHGWMATDGSAVSFDIADSSPLNENNPQYAVLTNASDSFEGIFNTGYLSGLAVTGGESYHASLFARGEAVVKLTLENKDGTVYAEETVEISAEGWTKYEATLVPSETVSEDLRFAVRISKGTLELDMISLMPEDTFAGLPIRKDIGQALQALSPSFIRFPGGCVIEGKAEESMYNWKDSIGNGIAFTINGENAVGDAATRPQTIDLWSGNGQHPYYCTYGLGFYEYFQLCEALDCFAIPVVNAGMTCPIQSPKYTVYSISSEEFKQCVQDALDLAEFCRGGADTTWGAVRIAMGHEEPFELRYIGIGNEQWQSEYHAHYEAFVEAFEKAAKEEPAIYGGIELIVANGPSSASTEGWTYVAEHGEAITTLVDEHYYEPPAWFLSNTRRYDAYDRNSTAKVFLGEYAAQSNTLYAALAEAAYMTGLERNGDIVVLACYAPLFGNATLNQWTPDMIFFSQDSLYLTPNYHVQKLFANNAGNAYLQTEVTFPANSATALSGKVGLGSWMTSVAYDNIKVVSNTDGSVLYENSFDDAQNFRDDFSWHEGDWAVEDGRLVQSYTGGPADETTGEAVYVGDAGWQDYTFTVEAEILKGYEGFLIPICVENNKNNIFWNVGGWGNTVSCLQIVTAGSKSGQVSGTVRNVTLQQGRTYELKVSVSGNNIKCYIDGILYVDYTEQTPDPIYASTVLDENGDLIIKVVNVTGEATPIDVDIPGLSEGWSGKAQVTVLTAGSSDAVNSFSQPENIAPVESTMEVSDSFTYEAPAYSLTVIRISK